jgi:hypothetical protein
MAATLDCARGEVPAARRVGAPGAAPAAAEAAPEEVAALVSASSRDAVTVTRPRYSPQAWFVVGLLWLAVFGSLAGYVASLLASR